MELISVIVPVYNAEQYLDQCIESIVNQTYGNLEIILIDDGSPDSSARICDEWRTKDNRIKVIHKENGGAGQTRNIGIGAARGEWISFIDSDDYISEKFYSFLMCNASEDIDVIECDYLICHAEKKCFDDDSLSEVKTYESKGALYDHIKGNCFKQVIWNKIYRSTVIKDIKFPEGKMIDDEFWTYKVLGKAHKLVTLKSKLYAYRQQEQSVMHKNFSLERLQALEAKRERLEYIKQEFPDLESIAKIDLWHTCMYLGQMSMLNLNNENLEKSFWLINSTFKQCSLDKKEIASLSVDYKIWAIFSKFSIKFVCKLRNYLKIGV